jgi:hypothetical protein
MQFATDLAEEILRLIYGDDYAGCKTNPARIAELIQKHLAGQNAQNQELLGIYEKIVEEIDLLSTPPEQASVKDPDALRNLLSERLDNIHSVTAKTITTIASVRAKEQSQE